MFSNQNDNGADNVDSTVESVGDGDDNSDAGDSHHTPAPQVDISQGGGRRFCFWLIDNQSGLCRNTGNVMFY